VEVALTIPPAFAGSSPPGDKSPVDPQVFVPLRLRGREPPGDSHRPETPGSSTEEFTDLGKIILIKTTY